MTRTFGGGLGRLRGSVGSHPWRSGGASVVVLALLAGGGYWIWGGSSSGATPSASRVTLVAAATGTIRESVSTTGTIEPAEDDSLNFSASGTVTSVKVAQGDKVTKGETLATIDSASLAADLAQARASLATAQAKVSADEDSTTTTSTQLSADKAAVTAASGQVSSAKSSLAGATLTSPITGVVASVDLTVGQQVSGSSGSSGSSGGSGGGSGGSGGTGGGSGNGGSTTSSSSSSTAQVEVIGTSSWVVDATVDATELAQVAKNDQAQITTDGATGTVFGTVSSVGVLPSSTSTTTAYPVTIAVTGNPSGLHSGASATIAIIYKQLSNVLTVPSLAVHVSGTKSEVYTMSGSTQVAKTVTTGVSSGGEVQILTGLTAGEKVVVQVPSRLGTGTTTRTGGTGTGTGTGTGGFGGGTGGFGGGTGGFGGGTGGFGGGTGGFGGGTGGR
jgi:membrane fusion protein, macrolide-specific efflux system